MHIAGAALAVLSCASGSANNFAPSLEALAPGQARSSIEGCLVRPLEMQEAAKAAANLEPNAVTVRATAGGVLIHDTLVHLCGLRGAVSLTFDKRHVTVNEQLVGQPSQCACNSTIDTALALEPGQWTVHVVRKENSVSTEVALEQVRVTPR